MARHARRLTISALDALRRTAESDRGFKAYVADAGQPVEQLADRGGLLIDGEEEVEAIQAAPEAKLLQHR